MQNKKENKLPFSAVSPEATGFDYFEYPELIPPNVQNVLNKYEHALVNGILYDELAQMLDEIISHIKEARTSKNAKRPNN